MPSKIKLIATSTTELNYSPKINTLSTFQATSGVFIITNMSFTSQPGSTPRNIYIYIYIYYDYNYYRNTITNRCHRLY